MKIVKLMFMFCCYGNVDVYVMKMAKLPSPMLASVTMCNDKIVELNSKINGIRWFGISYTVYSQNLRFHDYYKALLLPLNVANSTQTSISAVAKWPRDALCLSVVSSNSTKRRAESLLLLRMIQIYHCV